jgi:hypothetical protein
MDYQRNLDGLVATCNWGEISRRLFGLATTPGRRESLAHFQTRFSEAFDLYHALTETFQDREAAFDERRDEARFFEAVGHGRQLLELQRVLAEERAESARLRALLAEDSEPAPKRRRAD